LDALRGAERVIFEARATLELYASELERDRLLLVPYGVDLGSIDDYAAAHDRDALRRHDGFGRDDFVLVVIGMIEPRKSQAAIVLAFAEIAARFPHAKLVLVGDGPSSYSHAIRQVIERLGLGDRVELVVITSEIYFWYMVADAVVSASDLESMPRSLIEAMAFGRVVLSADVFGVPELISDGETGLLMASRDFPALVAGLERLLSLPPSDRAAIGRAAAAWVRERHDARGYVDVYRRLTQELVGSVN